MEKIIWTNEATTNLEDIFNYIAFDNPNSALKVVEGIIDKVETLLDFPNIGSVYNKKKEIRVILYGHYRIAYMIDDLSVVVLGVFHGAMEIDRYLN